VSSLKLSVAFPASIPEGKLFTISWDYQVSAKESRNLVFGVETISKST